jgi:hypothetical protein
VVDAHRHLQVLSQRGLGETTQRDERIAPEHAEGTADDQHPIDLGPCDPRGKKTA